MIERAPDIRRSLRAAVCSPLNRLLNGIDPPVLVLLYHRVALLSGDPELLAVTPDNFRAQMRYLKETVPVVRFEEDWQKAPRPAVAITFDDGYADNLLAALPILEEVGLPATFFISTGTIGTDREFWWHELGRLILEQQGLPPSFTPRDDRCGRTWPTGSAGERQEFYHGMVRLLNDAPAAERDAWLVQLRSWAGVGTAAGASHRSLTVEELRLLAASSLVTVGAHTVTHTRLASLDAAAQQEEITSSKRQLERWLGRDVTVFSYPFGRRCDYRRETVALCRQAGFTRAAANFPGPVHRWTDPYQLPRHLVRDWPVALFAEKLRGFWTR
jgi:peptidoglycan/xylan/chitin deacetylase (PgdA/CDA1 family)